VDSIQLIERCEVQRFFLSFLFLFGFLLVVDLLLPFFPPSLGQKKNLSDQLKKRDGRPDDYAKEGDVKDY
jgi:hypothetical protein